MLAADKKCVGVTAEGEEPISVGGLIDTIGNATYDVLLLGHDLLQKTLTSEGCVEDDGSWQLPDSARASGLAQQLEVEYAQLPDEERAAARVAGAGTGAVPASCTHGSRTAQQQHLPASILQLHRSRSPQHTTALQGCNGLPQRARHTARMAHA